MSPKSTPASVPGPEEQLLWLRDRLANNQVFSRVRGRAYDSVLGQMRSNQSRSSFRKWWTAHAQDLLVIAELLMKLRQDGWETAAKELDTVFCRDRWLYGEVVPAEKMKSHTVCVPRFKELLKFFRWFAYGRTKEEASLRWGQYDDFKLPSEFVDFLPNFDEHLKLGTARRIDINETLARAVTEEVVSPVLSPLRKMPCRENEWIFLRFDWDTLPFWTCRHPYRDYWSLARLVEGVPEEIEKQYYPLDQVMPVMWQLDIPVGYWSEDETRIGFHPQADHPRWAKRAGMFTSTTCHEGYGLAMFRSETPAAVEYIKHYRLSRLSPDDNDLPMLSPEEPFIWVLQQRKNERY